MNKAIGIRLPNEMIKKIDKLGNEEMEDRSTIIRKLVLEGYIAIMIKKAVENYLKGKISISKAAHQAGLTLWEIGRAHV